MDIVFATNNPHKIKEIRTLVGNRFRLLSLNDIGFHEDIPEEYPTIAENASAKAHLISSYCNIPTFADDTGLEVDYLDGRPGVYSARFAGKEHNDQANVKKLLNELKNTTDRHARFRTVISFWANPQKERLFEGIVEGTIGWKPLGQFGFGYDPVFIPEGYDKTFAQLPLKIKNTISHRARAFMKFSEYLRDHF